MKTISLSELELALVYNTLQEALEETINKCKYDPNYYVSYKNRIEMLKSLIKKLDLEGIYIK